MTIASASGSNVPSDTRASNSCGVAHDQVALVDLFCGGGGFLSGAREGGLTPAAAFDAEGALEGPINRLAGGEAVFMHVALNPSDDATAHARTIRTLANGAVGASAPLHLHASPPCTDISHSNRQRNDEFIKPQLDAHFRGMLALVADIIRLVQPASWSVENVPPAAPFFAEVPFYGFDPKLDVMELGGFGSMSVRQRVMIVRPLEARALLSNVFGFYTPCSEDISLPQSLALDLPEVRRSVTNTAETRVTRDADAPGGTSHGSFSSWTVETQVAGDPRRHFKSDEVLRMNGLHPSWFEYNDGEEVTTVSKTFCAEVSKMCVPPPAARAIAGAVRTLHLREHLDGKTFKLIDHIIEPLSVHHCQAASCSLEARRVHPQWPVFRVCELHCRFAQTNHAIGEENQQACQLCSGYPTVIDGEDQDLDALDDALERATHDGDKVECNRRTARALAWRNAALCCSCVSCSLNLCRLCLARNFDCALPIIGTDAEFICTSCHRP